MLDAEFAEIVDNLRTIGADIADAVGSGRPTTLSTMNWNQAAAWQEAPDPASQHRAG
jgi:hypothetical protein